MSLITGGLNTNAVITQGFSAGALFGGTSPRKTKRKTAIKMNRIGSLRLTYPDWVRLRRALDKIYDDEDTE